MSVVAMRSRLTESDVRALIRGPTPQLRAEAASKVCFCIDRVELADEERKHADAILRLMVEDAAVQVREALAATLRASPRLPRDVARALARDVDSIALPILEHSPVLNDHDLIELLLSSGPTKQAAIASRAKLSPAVAGVLAQRGAPAAVERALANDNADFSEDALEMVLTRFGDQAALTERMARRRRLPLRIAEQLIALVSGEVFDHLVNHHELPPQLAIDLAVGARERATLDLVEQASRQRDLAVFANQLNRHGRLTPSFLMRTVCMGQIEFVVHALAELARLPHTRAWVLMHDAGPLGLRTLFDRAGLPPRLFAPFRAAVDLYHQVSAEGCEDDRSAFRKRMLERVLTTFQNVPKDDLEYLLEKLDSSRAADRVSA
jgi:uncharacterized protein (DUF2336 family)